MKNLNKKAVAYLVVLANLISSVISAILLAVIVINLIASILTRTSPELAGTLLPYYILSGTVFIATRIIAKRKRK
jgi:hypothetical protein